MEKLNLAARVRWVLNAVSISKIWHGEMPLWKNFWVLGVCGGIIVWVASSLVFMRAVVPIAMQLIEEGLLMPFFLSHQWAAAVFHGIMVIPLSIIGKIIWKSATRYTGPRIWRLLAQFIVCLVLGKVFWSVVNIRIPAHANKTSLTVYEDLDPDPEYPLIGFWKEECSDYFGLAIDKAGDGEYSVVFCAPGGCGTGEVRPNADLYDDPHYRVIDVNHIRVGYVSGQSSYYRCPQIFKGESVNGK